MVHYVVDGIIVVVCHVKFFYIILYVMKYMVGIILIMYRSIEG